MNEKNLLAFFARLEDAQECQNTLRQKGFDVVQVDPIPSQSTYDTLNNAPQLSWEQLGYGADTAGMSTWGGQGMNADSWLLTAVVPAVERDSVAKIITRLGGQL